MSESPLALVEKIKTIELYQTIAVPLEYMRESEYNPNEMHSDEEFNALKESITKNKEFFSARPILLNAAPGREGVIVGGAKRYNAAKALGWPNAPAMFVYAETLEKEKAWNLLDNNHNGQLNSMKQQQIFLDLHSMGYDLTSLGHTPTEVNDIMSGLMAPPPSGEEGAGSIPAKNVFHCPECGYEGSKKDFAKAEPVSEV